MAVNKGYLIGEITEICQTVGCAVQYKVSSYAGTVAEYDIVEVPDTVTIEVERSVAIAILTGCEWYDEALKAAARQALKT